MSRGTFMTPMGPAPVPHIIVRILVWPIFAITWVMEFVDWLFNGEG